MWLLLIGQPLVFVCKPLSFFHFEVGGTWAHSKKNFAEKFQLQVQPTETVLYLSGFILSGFIFYYFTFYIVLCTMAEADKWHYNLRSGTNTVQLPVQIHMSNDSEFLTHISQNDQNSDSDDSAASELDCSAVIENSDTEQITGTESKQSTPSFMGYQLETH